MIEEIDCTISVILTDVANCTCQIYFDCPDQYHQVSPPAINCYLADISESRFVWEARGTTPRHKRYFDFTYVISCWMNRIADEHRMLSTILQALIRFPELSSNSESFRSRSGNELPISSCLQGNLAQLFPIYAQVTQPYSGKQYLLDLWRGFDRPPKPAIIYVVTFPLDGQNRLVRTGRIKIPQRIF